MNNATTPPTATARRRLVLQSAAALAASAALPFARAQSGYPNRPIRILCPFPPAGSTEIVARALADKFQSVLGQPAIVENKPGGNTSIGAQMVATAPPDGYTLLFTAEATHLIHTMQAKLPYDSLKDFAPVAAVSRANWVMVVNPSVPVKTLPELIAYAKANPGKLNYASAGIGNANHLGLELFNLRAGTKIVHVPYKGMNPGMQDLLAGRVDLMMSTVSFLQPQVDAGALRALAYTSVPPGSTFPTFAQYGFEELNSMESLNVLLAPAATPAPIIAQLSAAVQKVLAMPEVIEYFEKQLLLAPSYMNAQDLGQRMRADRTRFSEIIEKAHINLTS